MIRTKRDSLERFIQEQMEGPGACNNQFYCEGDAGTQDGSEEVLNTTPGSIYSTAVLFPQRKQAEHTEASAEEHSGPVSESELASDSNFQDLQDDNTNEDLEERANRLSSDEEDLYSLSQRFPTTIGLSCCIDKKGKPISTDDLKIIVSGRYYTKVSKANYTSIIIRVSEADDFGSFFKVYEDKLSPYFSLTEAGLKLASDITKKIGDVKDLILSINKELCAKVSINPDGSTDQEYLQIGDNYRYLRSYKERLWRKLRYFKDKYISDEQKALIECKMKGIERFETCLSYLEDAMNICNSFIL